MNLEGYEIDNCVPCCYRCNRAKSDMSSHEFKAWIKAVYDQLFGRIATKSVAIMCDELITTGIKCFMAQEEIDKAKTHGDRDAVAEASLRAQALNARRNQLMRAIDSALGFGDVAPTDKTYG